MTAERVHFRLIQTPCCSSLLCWVNPRLPSYCPECGASIYRSSITMDDTNATITYSNEALRQYHKRKIP